MEKAKLYGKYFHDCGLIIINFTAIRYLDVTHIFTKINLIIFNIHFSS